MSSFSTTFTELPPSCLQFAPGDKDILVAGTYYLDATEQRTGNTVTEQNEDEEMQQAKIKPEVQKKSGQLLLYRKIGHDLTLIQTISTASAVFDIRFTTHNTLVVALSSGSIELYTLLTVQSDDGNTDEPRLRFTKVIRGTALAEPGVSALYVTYDPQDSNILASTFSDGTLTIFNQSRTGDNTEEGDDDDVITFPAHPHYEAWALAFSSDQKYIYTGGDDSHLHVYDREMQDTSWRDKRSHGAGVTAILPWHENILLTGSYDQHLRIFDLRSRRLVHNIDLDGGVWRLEKMETNRELRLLASCMHAGAKIIDIDIRGGAKGDLFLETDVVKKFKEHESMNYGATWHPDDPDIVASCSFYDMRICIWGL